MASLLFFSVRLRKNSSLRKSEAIGESKKGQRLIEKEAMETGQVINIVGLPKCNDSKLEPVSWDVCALWHPGEVLSLSPVPACHGLGLCSHGLRGLLHPEHSFYRSEPVAEWLDQWCSGVLQQDIPCFEERHQGGSVRSSGSGSR